MNLNWPSLTIDDACEHLIDYRGKTPNKSDSGIRLVTAKVVKNGRVLEERTEYITDSEYERWMTRGIPEKGAVLLTTEAPLGEVAILRTDEKVALAQRIILLRAKPGVLASGFLLYALQTPLMQGRISARASGTTVIGIKNRELRKVEIPIPAFHVQQRIASILSTYDDLIENNRRRMALLEDAARQVYQEWFVRLRFPGHEHTRIGDGVPEGWRGSKLSDVCIDLRETASPNILEPGTPYIELEHIPRRSISLTKWGSAEQVTSTKLRFYAGEILFGKIRPYFHKVGVTFVDGVASSDTIVIRPAEERLTGLVLMTVSSDPFVANTSQTMREGSKMPRADWKQMKEYPVAVPPDGLLNTFNDTIGAITDQLKNLSFQNQKLRTARDLLLPKLMNGEISV